MSQPPPLPGTGRRWLIRRAFDLLSAAILLLVLGIALKFAAAFVRLVVSPKPATNQAVPAVVEKQPEFSPEVEASFQRAAQAHPDVAIEGTPMNRRMNELAEEIAVISPKTFQSPDWPENFARLVVAEQRAKDVESWQRVVVLKYPDIGVAGSMINHAFLTRVESTKLVDPSVFQRPDWPMIIADDTAEGLDVIAFKSSEH